MATKLIRMVTYLERLLIIKLFNALILQGHVTNKNHYISTGRVPMTTKLGRMITYLDELLAIEANGRLITWFCEIM